MIWFPAPSFTTEILTTHKIDAMLMIIGNAVSNDLGLSTEIIREEVNDNHLLRGKANHHQYKAERQKSVHTVSCICQRGSKPSIFVNEAVRIEIIRITALREARYEYETRMRNLLNNSHEQSDHGSGICGHRSDPPTKGRGSKNTLATQWVPWGIGTHHTNGLETCAGSIRRSLRNALLGSYNTSLLSQQRLG